MAKLDWGDNELYRELAAIFPEMRTERHGVLDITLLAQKLGRHRESIYKWIRGERIMSVKGIQGIIALANTAECRAALERHGRTPPTKQDLLRFIV